MKRAIKLARRPVAGSPVTKECFQLAAMPHVELKSDQIRAKTLWLSADPYMRCRFDSVTGVDYVSPFEIDEVITSGGIGVITESERADLSPGQLVASPTFHWPWEEHPVLSPGQVVDLQPINDALLSVPQRLLGVCGVTGLTGYFAVEGELRHRNLHASTVAVSAAAGATGVIACQLARARGARVVGVCGSATKGSYLVSNHVCDDYVNYKSQSFAEDLQRVCNGAIDVHIDNVGGMVNDEIIKLMSSNGKIVLVGAISQYNDPSIPYPPPLTEESQSMVDSRNIERERYLVLNYQSQFEEATAKLFSLVERGELRAPETILEGIESAPQAFLDVMAGVNLGKQLVKVND